MRAIVMLAVTTALLIAPASLRADNAAATPSFFEQAFLNAQGGNPCYARAYDDAHLKDHGTQTVRAIEIEMSKDNASDIPNTHERFELGFGLKVKKSNDWFTGVAICSAGGDEANCFIEGDGGRFRLSPAAGGAVKLETGDYGIALEGEKDFMSISGKDGDDRLFVLRPAPRAECEAATEHEKRPQP